MAEEVRSEELQLKLNILTWFFAVMLVACVTIYMTQSTMKGDLAECGDQPKPDVYTGSGNPNIVMPPEQFKILVDGWTTCKVAVVKKWSQGVDKVSQP